MRRVRAAGTSPERKIRSLLHSLGFRFRLYRKDLPGTPDIVFPKYRAVLFVHGCFWHRHKDCPRASTPSSNQDYWLPKFQRTIKRDRRNQDELHRRGWNVIVAWECELKSMEALGARLARAIKDEQRGYDVRDNDNAPSRPFSTNPEKE